MLLLHMTPSALGSAGASLVRCVQLLSGRLIFWLFSDCSYAIKIHMTLTIYCHFISEPALRRGESVYLVGLSRNLQATYRKSVVTNPCAALNISSADSPRYRATNMEVIELDTGIFSYLTIPNDVILEFAKCPGSNGIFCMARNWSGLKPFLPLL